ncbi:urea active transporter [Neopestalotiopsis sp. 37M]|nr:urea active transporter [Neopestalotiopsis sp. 37M]
MSSTRTLQVLSPSTGYGLVVGLGVAFTVIMIFLTAIQNRYGKHNTFKSTEEFNAASRSIKPGMIAAGIVSSWTHATTLLTSCMLAYLYGVSGGLWYGAVGTFQAYIVTGGLRSTFICDYLHTVVLYVIIFIFMFSVYTSSPHIGSPEALYDLLVQQSETGHAAGTDNGSYFTVRSRDSLVFGATIFLAGFSGVWTDQAYWQRAIASAPHTAVKGYVLGSLAWYAVPFAMSTCMGLAAAALQGSDVFPVLLSDAEVSAGLVAPAAAIALLGKSGACLIIVLLFMAVTSSTSAESIGASSLITFDIYKAYINPTASTRRLLWVSIFGLFAYGVVLAIVSCIFHAAGISLGWLVKIFGCLMGGGSFPIAAVVLWDRTSTFAAQASPILGLVSGLSAWMVTTKVRSGTINVTTTGDSFNSLAGDCVSLGVGLVSVVLLTFLFPEKRPYTKDVRDVEGVEPDCIQSAKDVVLSGDGKDKSGPATLHDVGTSVEEKPFPAEPYVPVSALNQVEVKAQKRLALGGLAFNTIGLMILLPFTLYGTGYTFSLGFFKAYVVVAFLWIWSSACICVLLPIWEARKDWIGLCKVILRSLA